MEPGLEHPGKQCARTGTSGGREPWTGTSGEATARDWNVLGPQKEEEMAAERSGKEHMNMCMDEMGKNTTDKRREVGEKEQKEKWPTTWNQDEDNRGSSAPGLVHPGARPPWIGSSGAPGGRKKCDEFFDVKKVNS